MEQVRLGTTGLHVSRLCLGMMSFGNGSDRPWVLDEAAGEPIVRRAVEAGVTFFDTADGYSRGASEIATGKYLRKFIDRDRAVLATKVFEPITDGPNGRGLSRKHILAGVDGSLRRLDTDHIDLLQIHRWDELTPIEETMQALDDVVRAGKVRYLGASTMNAWQFAKAQHAATVGGWTRFVSMQNHYNLLYREEEREMLPICVDQGVGILPWSPLARGRLARPGPPAAGPSHRSTTDPLQDRLYDKPGDADVLARVASVAQERGLPPAQVALAWLLHQPAVTAPVVGATRLGHLDDAIAATAVALSADELDALGSAYVPHAVNAP